MTDSVVKPTWQRRQASTTHFRKSQTRLYAGRQELFRAVSVCFYSMCWLLLSPTKLRKLSRLRQGLRQNSHSRDEMFMVKPKKSCCRPWRKRVLWQKTSDLRALHCLSMGKGDPCPSTKHGCGDGTPMQGREAQGFLDFPCLHPSTVTTSILNARNRCFYTLTYCLKPVLLKLVFCQLYYVVRNISIFHSLMITFHFCDLLLCTNSVGLLGRMV